MFEKNKCVAFDIYDVNVWVFVCFCSKFHCVKTPIFLIIIVSSADNLHYETER